MESVEVQEVDGKVNVYPDLTERTQTASVDYITSAVGADIESKEVVSLLNRILLYIKWIKHQWRREETIDTRDDKFFFFFFFFVFFDFRRHVTSSRAEWLRGSREGSYHT